MRPTPPRLKYLDLHPVRTLASAAAQCAAPAKAYGTCIAASYENVDKHMCQAEFQAFKACVQEKMKRKW
ncbi:hypothetical protein ACQY0O_001189 [Thecaphora frezii]